MGKVARRLLIGAGVAFGAIFLVAVGIGLFFDVNHYKPQIQAAVAKATGMDLRINGKASLKLFPRVRIGLRDAHLQNPSYPGKDVFAARELEVAPRIIPFVLHREMVVDQVALQGPQIHIEKEAHGRFNFESPAAPPRPSKQAAGQKPATEPGRINAVLIRDGELTYSDLASGEKIQLSGLNADLSGISWGTGGAMSSITLTGKAQASSLKSGRLSATGLKASFRDDHGLVRVDPSEAKIFGGVLRGNAQVDLRTAVPKIKLVQSVTHLDLAQMPVNQRIQVAGTADVSLNLSASGSDTKAITRTADGEVTLRSQNITLGSVDLDSLGEKFQIGQATGLASVASALVSGPLTPTENQAIGLAGSISGGKSVIHKLVADWRISHGIATAKDVAFATEKTTVAVKGNLDLIHQTYQNFYVATVDAKGCAKNKVGIEGSLSHPRPSLGSVGQQISKSYLGQAGGTIGADIAGLPGILEGTKKGAESQKAAPSGCDLFYSGSVLQKG